MEQFSHSPEYKLQVTNRTCVDIAEKVGHLSQYWGGGSLYGPAYSQNYWGGSSLAAHRKFTPMRVIEYFAKSLNVTQGCLKWRIISIALWLFLDLVPFLNLE